MGTFQYMAPEQLEGGAADARTDIFALGAVLFEMSTGRKAFEGKSRTSLIAAIVSSHPPSVSAVVPLSPPALDHVIHKCLEKDPDDRWQSARDVAAELRVGVAGRVAGRGARGRVQAAEEPRAAGLGGGARGHRRRDRVRHRLRPAGATTGAGGPLPHPARPRRSRPSARRESRRTAAMWPSTPPTPSGRRHVWVRALDELEPRLVPGTEGVRARPIWSPDSRQIAFFQGGKLKKVDIAGGPAQVLCDAPSGADGSWSPQGVILFDGRSADPLWSAPASGGPPRVEIEVDGKEVRGAGWPEFLPDGRHYLAA